METQALTAFFMWCTIINGGLLIFSTLVMMIMPDFVYKVQSRWFPVPRQIFDVVIYCCLGLFRDFIFRLQYCSGYCVANDELKH